MVSRQAGEHAVYEIGLVWRWFYECAAEGVDAIGFADGSDDSDVAVDCSFEEAAVKVHEVGRPRTRVDGLDTDSGLRHVTDRRGDLLSWHDAAANKGGEGSRNGKIEAFALALEAIRLYGYDAQHERGAGLRSDIRLFDQQGDDVGRVLDREPSRQLHVLGDLQPWRAGSDNDTVSADRPDFHGGSTISRDVDHGGVDQEPRDGIQQHNSVCLRRASGQSSPTVTARDGLRREKPRPRIGEAAAMCLGRPGPDGQRRIPIE